MTDLASAKRSDCAAFARFFGHSLDRGIYFAPSQFETGFLSTAHGPVEIKQTADVLRTALAAAAG